ncbi:MAG: hypothetical protein HYS05_05395 [Acidobacteria bacterium]|nr:hypothetical protein [Acidobacteriota bacterium]
MFQLPLAFEAVPERLAANLVVVTKVFEQAPSLLRQSDGVLAGAWHANRLDQPLLAEMPKISDVRICCAAVVIAEITTGDHSKRPDARERTGLGAAQCVLAIAIPYELPLQSTWQIEVARERFSRIEHALRRLAVAIGPARIIARVWRLFIGMRLPRVTRSAAEHAGIVIAVTRVDVGLPTVVTAVVLMGATATSPLVGPSFIVTRIEVARIEIHSALPCPALPKGVRTASCYTADMDIASGKVVAGRVEVDAELPEGASVTVLAFDGDETFEADAETEKMLLEAIAQCERGQTTPLSEVLSELRNRE